MIPAVIVKILYGRGEIAAIAIAHTPYFVKSFSAFINFSSETNFIVHVLPNLFPTQYPMMPPITENSVAIKENKNESSGLEIDITIIKGSGGIGLKIDSAITAIGRTINAQLLSEKVSNQFDIEDKKSIICKSVSFSIAYFSRSFQVLVECFQE